MITAAVPFDVEALARTALVRILPRSRYRLAASTDSRFASFAPNTARIAYRQQGAEPSFLLFSGPGHDPRAAALEAARWAEANWRPNAVQRRVRPGVVVVQVAPAAELATAGLIEGAAVPAAVWTVESESGRTAVAGHPPGAPPAGELRRAAIALAEGRSPPSLGELDLAERELLQTRTVTVPRVMGGALGIVLVLIAFRFGFSALGGMLGYLRVLRTEPLVGAAGLAVNGLLLAGILLGLGVLLNLGNLAWRAPGFSSPVARTRTLTWVGYAVAMVLLVAANNYGLPGLLRSH